MTNVEIILYSICVTLCTYSAEGQASITLAGSARQAQRGLAFAAALWLAALSPASLVRAAPPAAVPASEQIEFFESRIRPLLVERCYQCHSQESEKLKGGLLLDTAEGLLRGGETGPAIVPGDPDKSRLIAAVRYTKETLQMPPKGKLPDSQIADLEAWVRMGAPDPRTGVSQPKAASSPSNALDFGRARQSWPFRKPVSPPIPKVQNQPWVKSSLDAFVLTKLEAKGLRPAAPADKRTLIRRATFDLIGLPPMPEDVREFLQDDSPEAFAKVVERLLASPQYGERWGRHWLDIVRYADSLDSRFRPGALGAVPDISEAYRYRDWVVDAFNRDVPYRDFVRLQIAGDLLATNQPTGFDPDAIVATSMLSIGRWEQGCSDKEKMLTDVVDDQIDVTSRAFLGLTVACARCHDHKFDPITSEDYYGLAGIFFSSHVLPTPGPKGGDSVRLRMPLLPPAEIERRKQREARITELQSQAQRLTDSAISALAQEMVPNLARYLEAVWEWTRPSEKKSSERAVPFGEGRQLRGLLFSRWLKYLGESDLQLFTKRTTDYQGIKGVHFWRGDAAHPWLIANTSKDEVAYGSFKLPPRSVSVHPSPTGGVAIGWKSPFSGWIQIQGQITDGDPNCGSGVTWSLERRQARQKIDLASGKMANGGTQMFSAGKGAAKLLRLSVQAGDLIQLTIDPDKDFACDTTSIEFQIAEFEGEKRVWSLVQDVLPDLQSNPHRDRYGNADVWSVYDLANELNLAGLAANSVLQKWFAAVEQAEVGVSGADAVIAASREVQQTLLTIADESRSRTKQAAEGKTVVPGKTPNEQLYYDLMDPDGGFWKTMRQDLRLFGPEIRAQLAAAQSEFAELQRQPPPPAPTAHAIQEGGVPTSLYAGIGDAKIHIRGRYDRLGKTVPRQFPRILAGDEQPPITRGSGRQELADWIASPENPLTARVMVNRIWQYHFGEGIVRTPSNFGKLGVPPTHPELLDYLATAFLQSGWSVKAMHRLMMLSSVYQQSSHPAKETLRADPDNTLFGWMNRRRLEAEALRDSLLAVADNLDLRPRGPSTLDLRSGRRTLYLMTIRSDRNDFRTLFDAADAMALTDKRTEATVAPQALFLLNDSFTHAQCEMLARKLIADSGCATDPERIQWLYERLYARPARPMEIAIGRRALESIRASAAADDSQERERRAWEQYCHVLLCANEFIYVD